MQLKPHIIEFTRLQLSDLPDLLHCAAQGIKARVQVIVDNYGFEDIADADQHGSVELLQVLEKIDSELEELGIDEIDAEELSSLHDLLARIPEIQKLLEAESNRCDRCGQIDNLSWEDGKTLLCDKCSLEIENAEKPEPAGLMVIDPEAIKEPDSDPMAFPHRIVCGADIYQRQSIDEHGATYFRQPDDGLAILVRPKQGYWAAIRDGALRHMLNAEPFEHFGHAVYLIEQYQKRHSREQ